MICLPIKCSEEMLIVNLKKRELWVDYVKGFCMLLVVMSHNSWPLWYDKTFTPIFLTGFFFVSGYTFNKKSCFREFLFVKFKSLIVPILCLGIINTLFAYVAEGKPILDRLVGLVIQRVGMWDDLWFVACLFTMEIIYYFVSVVIRCSICKFIFSILLSICGNLYIYNFPNVPLFWHLDNACILIPFLCLGNMLRNWRYKETVITLIKSTKGILLVLTITCFYIFLVILFDNSQTNIHLRDYHNYVEFMITAFIGIAVLFVYAISFERFSFNWFLKSLNYVGQNTLVYYAFQFKIIRLVAIIGGYVGINAGSYLGNVISSILVCVILVLPAYIIKKYFPWMLGIKVRK